MQAARNAMMAGARVEACSGCYANEERGALSRRQYHLRRLGPDYIDPGRPKIKGIDYRPSNLCNAACVTCNSGYSSKIFGEYERMFGADAQFAFISNERWDYSKMESQTVGALTDDEVHSLEYVYLSGGEPTIMPEILRLLPRLNSNCFIGFNTNLKVWNEKFWGAIGSFKNVTVGPSIDGVGKSFEFIRYPILFADFKTNLYRLLHEFPHFKIILSFTFSILNIDQVLPVLSFASELRSNFPQVKLRYNNLIFPEYLSATIAPIEQRLPFLREFERAMNERREEMDALNAAESFDRVIRYFADTKDLGDERRAEAAKFIARICECRGLQGPALRI